MNAAHETGMLVITGDILHSKNTTEDERILLDWWLGSLEQRKIHTIIITGNHDHVYGEVTQLTGLTHLPLKYVNIIDRDPKVVVIDDIGFICMPWRDYTTKEIKAVVTQRIPQVLHCDYRVVVMHECLKGVKLDNGHILPTGTALPSITDITYRAIGDIHKFQRTNVTNGFYAGSPAQYRFDDQLPKGVIKVDLDHPSIEPTLIPINVKPLKTVSTVDDMTEDAYYKVVGNLEEVMKANREDNVVKSELRSEDMVLNYDKVGIVDGLAEYLAGKGIDTEFQDRGVSWVKKLLNLERKGGE